MAERVLVTEVGGDVGIGGIFLLPPLFGPGYLIYKVCEKMADRDIHPVLIIAAALAGIAFFVWGTIWFFRNVPVAVAGGAIAAYVAAAYGWAVSLVTHDPMWIGGVAILMGAGGYFVGRALGREGHGA